MNRAMRRTLRGWKADFNKGWRKLNTFMRIVLGTLLAIVLLLIARRTTLDPLQLETNNKVEQSSRLDMPAGLTDPADDSDVQQELLKIESFEASIIEWERDVKAAAAQPFVVRPAMRGEVLAALDALIARHRLGEYTREAVEEHEAHPVPVSVHRYRVTGSFTQIHAFLKALCEFPYLGQFDRFLLRPVLVDGRPAFGPSGARLQLEFRCTFFFHE